MEKGTIEVKVTTRAKGRSISVDRHGVYRIKTPLPPDKGRANRDIVDILARYLKIPKSRLTIIRGRTTNRKIIKKIAQ